MYRVVLSMPYFINLYFFLFKIFETLRRGRVGKNPASYLEGPVSNLRPETVYLEDRFRDSTTH
jgi:hypothetical protein